MTSPSIIASSSKSTSNTTTTTILQLLPCLLNIALTSSLLLLLLFRTPFYYVYIILFYYFYYYYYYCSYYSYHDYYYYNFLYFDYLLRLRTMTSATCCHTSMPTVGGRPVPRWPSRVMLKKSRQEKRRVFGGIGCKSSTRTDVLICFVLIIRKSRT